MMGTTLMPVLAVVYDGRREALTDHCAATDRLWPYTAGRRPATHDRRRSTRCRPSTSRERYGGIPTWIQLVDATLDTATAIRTAMTAGQSSAFVFRASNQRVTTDSKRLGASAAAPIPWTIGHVCMTPQVTRTRRDDAHLNDIFMLGVPFTRQQLRVLHRRIQCSGKRTF
ncbi:hypothetical protein [Burkholderia ubonensis]|uniref:hypothetical protein n=1 Tax=Burkholderia ubonensis TaxID=101571 RepID=UPI0008FEAE3E|nr:hypothetical protein [Burkholderia ubonensis]